MEQPIECSICMDNINVKNNYVVTECGHSYHTSCLMTNVTYNGYDCPYCRTKLADAQAANDDNDDETHIEEEDISDEFERSNQINSRRTLNTFRSLFQPANEMDFEEASVMTQSSLATENHVEQLGDFPDAEYISDKITEKGISQLELVKAMLCNIYFDGMFGEELVGYNSYLDDSYIVERKIGGIINERVVYNRRRREQNNVDEEISIS